MVHAEDQRGPHGLVLRGQPQQQLEEPGLRRGREGAAAEPRLERAGLGGAGLEAAHRRLLGRGTGVRREEQRAGLVEQEAFGAGAVLFGEELGEHAPAVVVVFEALGQQREAELARERRPPREQLLRERLPARTASPVAP